MQTHSSGGKHPAEFILTVVVAGVFGVIGKLSGVPVGALLFALIGVIALKLLFDRAYLPMWMKRAAQVLSGCYIGSSVTLQDVVELKDLIPCGDLTFTGLYGCLPGNRTRDGQNLRNEPTGIHVGGYSGRSQRYGADFCGFGDSKPGSDCFASGADAGRHFSFPTDHPSFGSFLT